MVKDKNVFRGAVALGMGAFISKLIGALYRVPLTNLLGGLGLGLYQMVFPIYAVLLDFSGGGLPSALSQIISKQTDEQRLKTANDYLSSSLSVFIRIGLIGTALMALLAGPVSAMQGDGRARLAYITLCPAIFLVAVSSCYRGYFQGLMNMRPTAVSQILEQIVKLVFGLSLTYMFKSTISLAVASATFAITLSELSSFLYLFAKFKSFKKKSFPNYVYNVRENLERSKSVLKITIPITLIGVMIPLSQVIDSFLIVNVIGSYRSDATALYGLLSGAVATVIGLPVSICYGVSAVAIPAVSSAKDNGEQNKKALKTLLLTLFISLPCTLFLLTFSPFVINLLFKGLPMQEKTIAINLLRLSSPCVVLLSVLQTSNGILIGKGNLYKPLISLLFGVGAKTVCNLILLSMPELNIFGGAISIIACYLVTSLINLIIIFYFEVKNENKATCHRELAG